jgi:hypothetical protein
MAFPDTTPSNQSQRDSRASASTILEAPGSIVSFLARRFAAPEAEQP